MRRRRAVRPRNEMMLAKAAARRGKNDTCLTRIDDDDASSNFNGEASPVVGVASRFRFNTPPYTYTLNNA